MVKPDTLFTQRMVPALNLAPSAEAMPLKMSHHSAEPANTPSTSRPAEG